MSSTRHASSESSTRHARSEEAFERELATMSSTRSESSTRHASSESSTRHARSEEAFSRDLATFAQQTPVALGAPKEKPNNKRTGAAAFGSGLTSAPPFEPQSFNACCDTIIDQGSATPEQRSKLFQVYRALESTPMDGVTFQGKNGVPQTLIRVSTGPKTKGSDEVRSVKFCRTQAHSSI
jgi:hypothetical protein